MKKHKFNIIAYTIGTLLFVFAVSIGILTMCKYGIELPLLALVLLSAFMVYVGSIYLVVEVRELLDETEKY